MQNSRLHIIAEKRRQ